MSLSPKNRLLANTEAVKMHLFSTLLESIGLISVATHWFK